MALEGGAQERDCIWEAEECSESQDMRFSEGRSQNKELPVGYKEWWTGHCGEVGTPLKQKNRLHME
jgi:hypothetical protein